MRRWMRDKLKQRKKSPESGGQAPLQPAYFNPENQDSAPESTATEPPPETNTQIESTASSPVPSSNETQDARQAAPAAKPQSVRRPRRRRGRGGRGRRDSGQPTPLAPVSAAPVTVAPASRIKGTVILAVGLPGSGKSSWFKRHNINPLSSDLVRALLFDDPNEQRFQELVFSNLRSMLRARLIAGRPLNYLDATNLTPHDRHSWIKLAKDLGYEVQAVYFDVPLEVCLARNQRRQRVVSEDVMRRMADKLKPPAFEEGFSKITVVRVKQKEQL